MLIVVLCGLIFLTDVFQLAPFCRFPAHRFFDVLVCGPKIQNQPNDLKKIIDDNSGMKVAVEIGKMWEEFEKTGDEALASAKVERIVLSADEAAKFKASNEKVVARWIEESKTKGFDGAALVEKARAAIAEAAK